MLQKISSIKVTFFCLSLLVVALLMGVALTFDKNHAAVIKSLSRQLPLTWLFQEGQRDPIVTTWFITICLVAGAFFLHLVCCIVTRLFRLIQNGTSPRQWLFFIIHIVFMLVMLCHGLSMIMGYKMSDVEMYSGQMIRFNNDYDLLLSDVRFVDDPAILNAPYEKQRAMMTRENIHRDKNYAGITLKKNEEVLASGRIYMLKPLRFGAIQITLTDFFVPQNRYDDSIGVKLVITRNPITLFFFCTYAIMIITLIGFIVITWRDANDELLQQMNMK